MIDDIDALPFEPLYPDVLGFITGGNRMNLDSLHVAVGIFPRGTYLNQPAEVVVLLQNMVDQPMEVKVAIQPPTRDTNGRAVNISLPKRMVSVTLGAGEVGVQRLPFVPQPPTQPGSDFPLRVAVRWRTGKPGSHIRPILGGAPPSTLAISTFKLQALREVEYADFAWNDSQENFTVYFDIANRQMPSPPSDLKPTYEPLWTADQFPAERQLLAKKIDDARLVADAFSRYQTYPALLHVVDEVYAARGLPLHPGEAKAIAKQLAFTLDDSVSADPTWRVEDTRWFQTLCQLLMREETAAQIRKLDPGAIAVRYLFHALLYDSILLSFARIRPLVRINLGDRTERQQYADRLMSWIAGQGEGDVSFIYLPLTLAGLMINMFVSMPNEDLWQMPNELREAYRTRIRIAEGEVLVIFDLLDKMILRAEDDLRRARVQQKL